MRYTTAQVAEHFHVSADTVRAWIQAGDLEAVNIAANATGRPEYRIDSTALSAFERRRSSKRVEPEPKRPPRRVQRMRPANVIPFF